MGSSFSLKIRLLTFTEKYYSKKLGPSYYALFLRHKGLRSVLYGYEEAFFVLYSGLKN